MSTLPAIFLNQEFYTKARNRKFIKEHGCEAIVILQMVWLASSQEKDCKIKKEECLCLAFPVPLEDDKIKLILKAAVEVGLLDEEGDYYYNSQIVSNNEKFQEKQKKYSTSAKKREEAKHNPTKIVAESYQDSTRILPESYQNPAKIVAESLLTVNSKQLIVNNKKIIEDNLPIDLGDPPNEDSWIDSLAIPEGIPEEETRKALRDWAFTCKKNRKHFGEIEAEALLLNGFFLKERFPEAIRQAISNSWKNIRFDALPSKEPAKNTHANAPNRKLSPTEMSMQAASRVIEKLRKNEPLKIE